MSTDTVVTETVEQAPSEQAVQTEQVSAEQQGAEPKATESEEHGQQQRERRFPESIPYSRFSEVVGKKNAAEQRAAELERRIAELTGQRGSGQSDDFPDPTNFNDLDSYKKAVREYHDRTLETRLHETTQQTQARLRDEAAVQSFNVRMAQTMEKNPQIVQAVEMFRNMEGDFHPDVFRAIVHEGPDAVWEIATNPDLAERLIRATPFQAGRLLASIGASAPTQQIQQKPSIQRTQTVSGGAKAKETDPAKMTQAEYFAWREKQE